MRNSYVVGVLFALSWGQSWQNVGGGVDNPVEVLYSAGGYLYVGGRFSYVGGTALQANGIARYGGAGWQQVGPGQGAGGSGRIYAITEYQGKIIVGGEFSGIGNSSAQNLAAYDPVSNTWSAVGGGVSGPVYALGVYDGELLVGGGFTQVNVATSPQTISFFARWNGSQWLAPDPSNPSQLLVGGVPRAFVAFQNKLYVAGSFVAAYYNETDKAYLAVWNKSLQRLEPAYVAGQGPNNNIWCAVVWNNALYLGGDFTTFGSASGKLVRFTGTQAQSVSGAPTSGSVRALLPVGNDLYVAGSFTIAGGLTVNRVAKLSASGAWSALGSGLGATIVSTLAWHNNFLYAGGGFTTDGAGNSLSYIAVFTGGGSSVFSDLGERGLHVLRIGPGEYMLSTDAVLGTVSYSLLDGVGRVLQEGIIGAGETMSLPPLSSGGIYLLRVQTIHREEYCLKLVAY